MRYTKQNERHDERGIAACERVAQRSDLSPGEKLARVGSAYKDLLAEMIDLRRGQRVNLTA